jgi:hypothetical protein
MPVRPPGKAWLAAVPVVDDRVMSPTQRRFIMEPRREEPKAPPPGAEPKPKRFRIVKLEERIAPSKGGNTVNAQTCACGTGSYTGAYPCCSFGCYSGNGTQCWCR